MPYEIVRNDITNMIVDAIVNTANPLPIVGAGVDHAIHSKAGPELQKAREKIGKIAVGDAKITPAFLLDAKYVIHAVSPKWVDGNHYEERTLFSAYYNSLLLASKFSCSSIAFPLMATGTYRFPKELALEVALRAFQHFLTEHEMMIYLVIFDLDVLSISSRIFSNIQAYIDEEYVKTAKSTEYFTFSQLKDYQAKEKALLEHLQPESEPNSSFREKLSLFLDQRQESYYELFARLIDARGWNESRIYNKAGVSRQIISKIRNDPFYRMTKKNLMALTFCLELDLEQTEELLARGDYALNPSKRSDLIYMFFISHRFYNTAVLDDVLYEYGEQCLYSEL